jgi:hypothetical protein
LKIVPEKLRTYLRKPVEIDEGALRARSARANSAEELQRNTAFTESLAEIEAFYLNAWRSSTLDQVELRERAHIAVSLIDDLRNCVLSRVRDGELARASLRKTLES